jgi:uroporphyrinogen decarboxylase
MSEMSKRERVMAALRGDEVDRPPVSFWGHDFLREWSAQGLADAMLESVREYDYDYLKVNPRATYYAEAWGCRFRPSNDAARAPEGESWVVRDAADLKKIEPVDGTSGVFAEQLAALHQIGAGLGGEVPFVQTVFSPLSVVGRLTEDRDAVKGWIAREPEPLHSALAAVTETLAGYARACLDSGAEGIFLPTTEWGTFDALDWQKYETFGRPYDLRVLEAVAGAPFNILHVCRPNNMLAELLDYPVAALNWADRASGNLSLREAQAKTGKAVMGGIDERHTLLEGPPGSVSSRALDAVEQTGGRRFLLAPGCSISPQTPAANIHAAVQAVR